MMRTVFTYGLDLLCHTPILFFTARITAVGDDVSARGQRTILPDEVEVSVV
jgi:hypothetical protein